MHIKSRQVTMRVVDEINLTPREWDSRFNGTVAWREHMAKILNQRVIKTAPQCKPVDFYKSLLRFSTELGFGEEQAIAKVTERVYDVKLRFLKELAT